MRSALLMVAGCVFCLSQPGFADEHFAVSVQFSKPNVTYNAFLHDRNACLGDASHQGWSSLNPLFPVRATPTYSFVRFSNCMLAKGYKPDPNGFYAATFSYLTGDQYRLMRL